MASLQTISETVLRAEAYYLKLVAEYVEELHDTGTCSSDLFNRIKCLNRLLRALNWDIEDSVNDDTTTILYNMLITEVAGFSGNALAVDDLVVTHDPPIIDMITGPPGPQGERGLTGEQGQQGIQGPKGDQGEQGIQGEQGVPGENGEILIAGEIANLIGGLVDPTAADGLDGYYYLNTITRQLFGPKAGSVWPPLGMDLTGPQGPQGIQGPKGDQGIPGIQGDQGISGAQGVKGDKGDKGDQGIAGVKGDKGDTGEAGEQGVPGAPGEKGDTGETGPVGPTGPAGADGSGGDFVELNRDVAFTVIDNATDNNEIGKLTSNGVDTLELQSPTGAVYASFQEEEYTPEVVVIPELDIVYSISNAEALNLTVTFKNEAGTVLGTHTNGSGVIGAGGTKPLSNELLSVVLSSTGTGALPVDVKLNIRKDGVIFDPFHAIYETEKTGIITTNYIQPTEMNVWEFEVVIVTVEIPEEQEVDTPPVVIITKSLVGGSDTIIDGSASSKLYGEDSYDAEGHALTFLWIFDSPNVNITDL